MYVKTLSFIIILFLISSCMHHINIEDAKSCYFNNKKDFDRISEAFLSQNDFVLCSRRIGINSISYWIMKSYQPTIDTLLFFTKNKNLEMKEFENFIKTNSSDSLNNYSNIFLIEIARFLQKHNLFMISIPLDYNYVKIYITRSEGLIYTPIKLNSHRKNITLEWISTNWYFFKDNS